MAASEAVYRCRALAAELFHVPSPEQVVLTMNATHALNLAIRSRVRPGGRAVISGFEHNSVTRPLYALAAEVRVARAPLFDPAAQLERFDELTRTAVDCVICSHVSNVFGCVQPVEELAALCRARGIPLILDASQSAGSLDVDFAALGADFIAMPGHKGLYGPQGTGLLLCGGDCEPLLCGGTGSLSKERSMPAFLPDRLEAGTHNVPGAAGLAEGLRYVLRRTPGAILRRERELLCRAARGLEELGAVELFGAPEEEHRAGALSFRVPDMDCEAVAAGLSEQGIAIRAGLHCAPLAHETAGTLDTGTVRISVSDFTRPRDIRRFLCALGKILP